jgi:hypothetical protein
LARHADAVPVGGSNWISTSHQQDVAGRFAGTERKGDGHIYVINNPGCGEEVDCDPDVIQWYKDQGEPDPLDSSFSEHEIAFNRPIPGSNVAGYFPVVGGVIQPFQKC